MTALFLAILVLSLLLLAYYRIPLLISIAILAGLTFAFTELRHFYEIPAWFRWSLGIADRQPGRLCHQTPASPVYQQPAFQPVSKSHAQAFVHRT